MGPVWASATTKLKGCIWLLDRLGQSDFTKMIFVVNLIHSCQFVGVYVGDKLATMLGKVFLVDVSLLTLFGGIC